MTIQRSLEYPDYSNEFRFVEPKTSRSRRSITISQVNLNLLREHRRVQGEKRLKKGADWQQHDLVFCTREGKPIQARNVLRDLKHRAAAADPAACASEEVCSILTPVPRPGQEISGFIPNGRG